MTFVITEPCLGTCDTACVDVCPTGAIHGPIDIDSLRDMQLKERINAIRTVQLYIDPDSCIDCGLCEPECPVDAIFDERDVPEKWRDYIEINAAFFKT